MISLAQEEYDNLLDRFLHLHEFNVMARQLSPIDYLDLSRKCFELAYAGQIGEEHAENDNERGLIDTARAMLIGYQMGKTA